MLSDSIMAFHPIPFPLELNDSFSLEGEDRLAVSILRKTINEFPKDSKFFYLDIGCNDPISLSNTFLFYNLGFSGLCVDPLIESKTKFREKRGRDKFINAAVSNDNAFKSLRVYSDDSSSSLDEKTISRYDDKFKVRATREVETTTLKSLLEKQDADGYSIPFVDIDVEGMDEIVFQQVLQLEYKPLLVCVENKLANLNTAYPSTQIDRLALESGYSLICKTLLNSFYINFESDAFDWIPQSMVKLC